MDIDHRIQSYIDAIRRLKEGNFSYNDIPASPPDEIGQLGIHLQELTKTLEEQYREIQKIGHITSQVNAGILLDDILKKVYKDFREIIPYNRIGLSLIEEDGKTVRARWAKTDQPKVAIRRGYSAPLAGSSLQTIVETGQPRIINDLVEYLKAKPDSVSTQLIISEGIRSSLTCPLIANGIPVGFIYFSSIYPHTYTHIHVDTFLKIAEQLSVIVEKGRLVSELASQKEALQRQHSELQGLYERQNEYLQEVARITKAAADVETGNFDPKSISGVAERPDALGKLAQVFLHMADEVYAREQELKQQVHILRLEVDQIQRTQQVASITNSEFFQDLKKKSRQLRSRNDNDPE